MSRHIQTVDRPADGGTGSGTDDLDALLAELAADAAAIDLQALFDELNARYFGGRLPRYTVVRDEAALRRQETLHTSISGRRHPGQMLTVSGCCDDAHQRITVGAYVTGNALRDLLLHEMCHIQQPGRPGHGAIFKARARAVARRAGIPLARLL